MNRATVKQQNLRNSDQVNKFYNQVLSSFIFRLYKDYRYKNTVQQEQITELQKLVKQKINSQVKNIHSQSLFDIYLKKKQTTKDCTDLQMESNMSKDKTVHSQFKTEDIKKNDGVQKNQTGRTEEEEEEIDDLAEYQDQVQSLTKKKEESVKQQDLNQKIEQASQIHQKEPTEVKEIDDEQSESNSIDLIERAQKKMGTAIIGTFSSFHIKRKPKQQKIFLELQNVFVKYVNTSNENFFSKIICELSKIEKEDIKQLKK